MRLIETGIKYDKKKFVSTANNIIRLYRLFGLKYALNQINDLTKGFMKSKFIREGKYWYGDPSYVQEARKAEAKEKIYSPDRVDYQITSALNKS